MSDVTRRFEEALLAEGARYLELERELRRAGPAAVAPFVADARPLAALLARVLVAWPAGKHDDALAYIEGRGARAAAGPTGTPDPEGVAKNLDRYFGGDVRELIALRVMKETDAPQWRVMSMLVYLRLHPTFEASEPVLRLLTRSEDPFWRDQAVRTLRAIGDPRLPDKAREERARLRASARSWPPELDALAHRKLGTRN
jgi:hypothetical protein